MRVLITGGAGFIGSHLCEAFLERGDVVHVLDDLSTGSFDNIAHLRESSLFRLHDRQRVQRSLVAELIDDCDVVFHLAAAVGVKLIVQSPVRTIQNNVHGTEVVLALADKKQKRVLLTSTSEVYGLSQQVPFREDGPLSWERPPRGGGAMRAPRRSTNSWLWPTGGKHRLPTTIARLFNTVGPRQTGRYGMVVPTFVKQALAGRPITVHGDGTQSRCFTHVADVVSALISSWTTPRRSVRSSTSARAKKSRSKSWPGTSRALRDRPREIVHVPYSEAYEAGFEDMPRRVPDITKAARMIGFRPSRDLDQILHDVIAHELASGDRKPAVLEQRPIGNSRLVPVA